MYYSLCIGYITLLSHDQKLLSQFLNPVFHLAKHRPICVFFGRMFKFNRLPTCKHPHCLPEKACVRMSAVQQQVLKTIVAYIKY